MRALFFAFVAVLYQVTVVVADLTFQWPKYPEENVEFSLQWTGGTPPYTVYVLTPDLSKYYYKYTGSALSTTYNFPMTAGTEIAFECLDSANLFVTSPTITVISTLDLTYPTTPQVGVASTITWSGGISPYTVYVLTPDLSKYYYKYTGSALVTTWTPAVNAGTDVVFQVLDSNGVTFTGNQVTVGGGDGGGSASLSSQSVLSTQSVASVASVASLSQGQNQESQSILSVESTASVASVSSAIGGKSLSQISVASTASVGTATITNSAGFPSNTNSGASNTRSSTSSSSTLISGGGGGGSGSGSGGKSSSNVGAIAGGVAGGVVGLVLVGILGVILYKRNHRKNNEYDEAIYGAGYGGEKPVPGGGVAGVGDAEMREPTLPQTGYNPSSATGANTGNFNPQEAAPAGWNADGGVPGYGQPGYQPSIVSAGQAGMGAGAGYYGAQQMNDQSRPLSEAYSTQLPYAGSQPSSGYEPGSGTGSGWNTGGSQQPLGGSGSYHTGGSTGGGPHSRGPASPTLGPHGPAGFSGLPEV